MSRQGIDLVVLLFSWPRIIPLLTLFATYLLLVVHKYHVVLQQGKIIISLETEDERGLLPARFLASNMEESAVFGCDANLQALLFCYILNDLHISFEDKEIQVYPSSHEVLFRNRTFQIMLPIHVVRNCLIKHQPTVLQFTQRNIRMIWCKSDMLIQDGEWKLSLEELQIFNCLNQIMSGENTEVASVSSLFNRATKSGITSPLIGQ